MLLQRSSQFAKVFLLRFSETHKMPFYAVKRGRNPGVYSSWPECQNEVKGFQGARYKKFNTEAEAFEFANEQDSPPRHKSSDAQPMANQSLGRTQAAARVTAHAANSITSSVANSYPASVNHASTHSAKLETETIAGPPIISSTRLLALKGTMQHISQTVAHLQQFCTQAEQQLEQIGKKRRGCESVKNDAPPTSRRRLAIPSTDTTSSNTDGLSVSVDGYVNVYTDGCCHNNGQAGAVAGIGVFWAPDHPLNISEGLPGKPTNNRAEIHAASKAAWQAKEQGISNLAIHTDSQFTINGITKWMHKWKKNGWRLSTGGDVINKEDFLELDRATDGLNVKWVHVRGHMGDPGNEEADRLANEGARSTQH